MGENEKDFVKGLAKIVESKVLPDGWRASESHMKTLYKKDSSLQNFGASFNGAVLNTFCDALSVVSDHYKIPEKLEKLQDPANHPFLPTGNVAESMSDVQIRVLEEEKKTIQQLIDAEMQQIQEIKQRIEFLMSSANEGRKEFEGLKKTLDNLVDNVKMTSFQLKSLNKQIGGL